MPRGRRKKRLSRMDAAVDAMLPYGFPEERVLKNLKQLLTPIISAVRNYGSDAREHEVEGLSLSDQKIVRSSCEPPNCAAYGGDEGWPFIEDCSYKELLEALLRDQETDDQVAQGGDQIEDQSGADEEPASPSNRAADTSQEPESNSRLDIAPVAEPTCPDTAQTLSAIRNAVAERIGWKDIPQDQTVRVSENGQKSPTCEIPGLPYEDKIPSLTPPKSRKRMPCNGWIEEDEDDNTNDFITLEPGRLVFRETAVTPGRGRRLRKSRWDVKPDDP